MAFVSQQEYQSVLSEFECLKEKFMALEQENHRLLGDLQQVTMEKRQQHEELTLRVQQLEANIISLLSWRYVISWPYSRLTRGCQMACLHGCRVVIIHEPMYAI